MDSDLCKINDEYKKHSGGVNKALIRRRKELRQGKQEATKKQFVKKRRHMDHFRAQITRTPLRLNIASFPNVNIDLYGGGEAPMFLDTEHAQRTIIQVLSQYYLREENDANFGRDDTFDGSEYSYKSEKSNRDSDLKITTEAYLQEAYNYLYHQHVNSLTNLIREAKLETAENLTKKRLHIGQHYFLQNEGHESSKSHGEEDGVLQVVNEDSNDDASEVSDLDDNEEKHKQILSSMKEHLELSMVVGSESDCPINSQLENDSSIGAETHDLSADKTGLRKGSI